MSSFDSWHDGVVAAALVGTARRAAPDPSVIGVSPRPGASAEVAALDAAALVAAVRRGSVTGAAAQDPHPAPPDRDPEAPPRAAQLLEMAITQPPVGVALRPQVIAHWLRGARSAGYRVPDRMLPSLLDLAAGSVAMRGELAGVDLGPRATWLAALNPDWAAWAGAEASRDEAEQLDPSQWATLAKAERLRLLARLRETQPTRGRELVESTWSSDPAAERQAHLQQLRTGLGPSDEELLERALDDRAKGVRETACELLASLPRSALATRMAERLRPLISTAGLLRKTLVVALPEDPDAAGVRDGLGSGPQRRSQRGWWLEQITAGAPLTVWSEATGLDPDQVASRLESSEVIAGLSRAAVQQRDTRWAQALLGRAWNPSLLEVLATEQRADAVLQRLRRRPPVEELGSLVAAVPPPWTAAYSTRIVDELRRHPGAPQVLGLWSQLLASRLHPRAEDSLRAWRAQRALPERAADILDDLLQFHSFLAALDQAFTEGTAR